MKIFINSGHCIGTDPGACGNGIEEAKVCWNISNRVSKYLQAVGYVTKVFSFDGLAEICNDANDWGADLFISIHCNAFNGRASGTETFSSGFGESSKLATAIQNRIVKTLGTVNRGVKQKGLYVVKYTNMPAVLVETAFIDNPADAELLIRREDDFARAIACGVTDYCSSSKPVPDVVDTPKKISNPSKLSTHFDKSEFACHYCGHCTKIHPRLLELLEQLRADIGNVPIHINSGYRCPTHNANVGGVPNSQHVIGTAADLAVPSTMALDEFVEHVKQLPFDWVGIYPYSYFVHVDVRNGGIGTGIIDYME